MTTDCSAGDLNWFDLLLFGIGFLLWRVETSDCGRDCSPTKEVIVYGELMVILVISLVL